MARKDYIVGSGNVVEFLNVVHPGPLYGNRLNAVDLRLSKIVNLPIFGEDGWPREFRGEVADAPGVWFCGLSFQYSVTSMFLLGATRDAKYVARGIARVATAHAPVAA